MRLTPISPGALLEQVLDDTYPIWGDGLSRQAYGQWNLAQTKTRWGRDHLQRVGLVEGDRVVASAKRYLFNALNQGASEQVLGIGAVFTPSELRSQGHAARLIEAMMVDAAQRGCARAILFSEIGPEYYRKLGFAVIARGMVTLDVPRSRRGAPGTLVRSLEPADVPEVAAISRRYSASAGFGLDRTADLIEFGIARRRLRAGLGPLGLRQLEAFVSEEGHKPVSYVVISRGPEGTTLEDCGDRDPAGARIGAMLEALAERDPSLSDRTLRAWLPPAVRPPQLRVSDPFPAPEVMMERPIGPSPHLTISSSPEAVWCPLDVF